MQRAISALLGSLALILSLPAAAQTWSPPIGIPPPPFGIEEVSGAYTHYVDNSAGNCSDAGNGSTAQPRCSIPADVPAGAVVEIHGGPYGGNTLRVGGVGSAGQPVFYHGGAAAMPVIEDVTFEISGAFVVVEGLEITGSPVRVGTGADHHLALRGCHVHHHPTGSLVVANGADIVIADSHIHHNTRTGNDGHGIHVAAGSTRVWVVDNDVHHHTGDGIQFCHGCDAAPPEYVYVGRNRFYTNRENGVDIKYARYVVISENIIYDHASAPADVEWCFEDNSLCGTWSSGSDGSAAVLGSDGGPSDIWFIANVVYDAVVGVRNEETYDAWIVGNVIRDIEGSAIALEKVGQPLVISHNTITRTGVGVDQFWQPNFTLTISNNIFAGLTDRFLNIETDTVAAAASLESNLFWNDGAAVSLRWVTNQSFSITADFNGFSGGSGNLVASPGFAGGDDLHLQTGSAAIDAANTDLNTIDTDLRATFGAAVTVLVDADGVARPIDGDDSGSAASDIGAYEYDANPTPSDGGSQADGGAQADGAPPGADGGGSGDTSEVGPDYPTPEAVSGCSCSGSGISSVWLVALLLRLRQRRR